MTIPSGTKLGRYEIRSQLGAGGMGEVYRARDEKLNRDVAIKVLPTSLSQDQDRLRRFEQEAQAVPVPLFQTRVPPSNFTGARNNYVVAADGQRFLVNNVVQDNASQPITVVLNWTAQLKK